MVFLIQRAQNKDSPVTHLKFNRLIATAKWASNCMINARDLSEAEINVFYQFYCLLAEKAKQDTDLGQTHSVEETEDNHEEKMEVFRDGQ